MTTANSREIEAKEKGSGNADAIKEDWEDMFDDDADSGDDAAVELQDEMLIVKNRNKSFLEGGDLSESMRQKLAIEAEEEQYQMESACDLLGVPSAAPPIRSIATSSNMDKHKQGDRSSEGPAAVKIISSGAAKKKVTYALDESHPRTKEDYAAFQQAITEKIQSHQGVSYYNGMVTGIINSLASTLPVPELRKLVGEMQTLVNRKTLDSSKAANMGSTKPGVRPSLKYGGSMKTGFDHGAKQRDDEDDYDEYDDRY